MFCTSTTTTEETQNHKAEADNVDVNVSVFCVWKLKFSVNGLTRIAELSFSPSLSFSFTKKNCRLCKSVKKQTGSRLVRTIEQVPKNIKVCQQAKVTEKLCTCPEERKPMLNGEEQLRERGKEGERIRESIDMDNNRSSSRSCL